MPQHWKDKEQKLRVARSFGFNSIEEAFEELYLSGYSIADLAVIFGITKSSAGGALHKIGVPTRSRGGPNNVKGENRRK